MTTRVRATRRVTAYLTPDEAAAMQAHADAACRTTSQLARVAIREYLARHPNEAAS